MATSARVPNKLTTLRAKPLRSVVTRKINARKGGLARAQKTTKEQRQAWGEKAGTATLTRYGADYFRHIRSLRTNYPKKLKRTNHGNSNASTGNTSTSSRKAR